MSLASEEELDQIYTVLKKFNVSLTKITAGQRLAVYGVEEKEINALRHALFTIVPKPPEISVTYVQACPSLQGCKYATRNSQPLGRRLEHLSFNKPLPDKIKVSIASCRICCTEPWIRDIGIIGSRKGWTLIFGGNGGSRPRIGDLIAEDLHEDQLVQLVEKCIHVYQQHAMLRHRTARFIENFGIERFKQAIRQ